MNIKFVPCILNGWQSIGRNHPYLAVNLLCPCYKVGYLLVETVNVVSHIVVVDKLNDVGRCVVLVILVGAYGETEVDFSPCVCVVSAYRKERVTAVEDVNPNHLPVLHIPQDGSPVSLRNTGRTVVRKCLENIGLYGRATARNHSPSR